MTVRLDAWLVGDGAPGHKNLNKCLYMTILNSYNITYKYKVRM